MTGKDRGKSFLGKSLWETHGKGVPLQAIKSDRMKRFVIVFLAVTAALYGMPVSGQVHFGVKAGLNGSTVSFSDPSAGWGTGLQLGPMVEVMVPLLGIGADAAVVYSTKENGQIEVPIHAKWKVGIPAAKFFLATGPSFSVPLSGNVEKDVDGVIKNLQTKSFRMGWDFGAGAELIQHLQVGLNYGLGLTNNYAEKVLDFEQVLSGKERGWSLTLAWLF